MPRRRYTRRRGRKTYMKKKRGRHYTRRKKRFNPHKRRTVTRPLQMHKKVVRQSRYNVIMRPLFRTQRLKYYQNSIFWEATVADFTTGLGHFSADVNLGMFMNSAELTEVKTLYNFWKLHNIHLTAKLIGQRNLVKYTDFGGSAANVLYGYQTEQINFLDLWFGFFRSSRQQDEAIAIDADSGLLAKERLLETGQYRRLTTNRALPVTHHWYQSTAFKGAYAATDQVAGSTTTTSLSSMFTNVLQANDQPHAYDIMLFDRNQWINPTAAAQKMTLRFQIMGTMCVELAGPYATVAST